MKCFYIVSTLETKKLSTSVPPNKTRSYFTCVAKKIIVMVTHTLIYFLYYGYEFNYFPDKEGSAGVWLCI